MSDSLNLKTQTLFKLLIMFVATSTAILFLDQSQLFILTIGLFILASFSILGSSIRFFYAIFFYSPSQQFFSKPINLITPSNPLAKNLSILSKSHHMGAIMEETFYEDNLQMGDFFLTYPIFFKASLPESISIPLENEVSII